MKTSRKGVEEARKARQRNATASFYNSLVLILIGTLIIFYGVFLVITGFLEESALTGALGIFTDVSSGIFFVFHNNADKKICQMLLETIENITNNREVLSW